VEGVELTRERRGAGYEARWAQLVRGVAGPGRQEEEEQARKVLEVCDRSVSQCVGSLAIMLVALTADGRPTSCSYGFFSHEPSERNRVAALPASAYSSLPVTTGTRRPSYRNRNSSKLSLPNMPHSSSSFTTSNLSIHSPRPDSVSSASFKTRHERHREQRSRQKEASRIDKWAKMMYVARKDAGGNAIDWSFSDDSSLLPKVRWLRECVVAPISSGWLLTCVPTMTC
jgi:hypothetical protein